MKRFGVTIILWLAASLFVQAANPKLAVELGKRSHAAAKPLEQKDMLPIYKAMAGYPAPQAAAAAPSGLLEWARQPHPHQVINRADMKIHTHLDRGVIAVEPPAGATVLAAIRPSEKPTDLALRFIGEHPDVYGIKSAPDELALDHHLTDETGHQHIFFQQHYRGVPIWGRQLAAHLDPGGGLASTTGYLSHTPEGANIKPSLSPERAIEIAEDQLLKIGIRMNLKPEQKTLLGFSPPRPTLYFWQDDPLAPPDLAWVFELRPNARDWYRFFISAADGRVLDYYNATTNASSPATASATNLKGETVLLNTYKIGASYYMMDGSHAMFLPGQSDTDLINTPNGVVLCLDLRNQLMTNEATYYNFTSPTNTWTDKAAVSALDYGARIYEYYKTKRGRSSFDNAGKSMKLMLHVPEDDGTPMDNAYWNGEFVALGDGYQEFLPLARALDVIAHEFTHAHVQYTAGLEYRFQSGALNESYADLGGTSVDNANYTIGEDVVKLQYFPTGSLRDMANPHNGGSGPADLDKGWAPANMSEYVTLSESQDHGGVHVNNGITNFAMYKILSGLGRPAGEAILFGALTNYLGKKSNFSDFRIAATKTAGDLYGTDSTQQKGVKKAFDDVGIVEGSATQPPLDTPVTSGTQYLMAINNVDSLGNPDYSLLISNAFTKLSEIKKNYTLTRTQVNVETSRPFAVDPYGQWIWFVDDEYNLRAIKPNGTGEYVVSGTKQWSSVAVSPSGNRIALTRNFVENKIVIVDGKAAKTTEWVLTHPTTSQGGTTSDIVNYADAMAFIDEQYLVYDCSNSIKTPGGDTVDFWDINILDVNSGQIMALLPPMSAGIHIMNPSLATTNKSVLCMEVYQEGHSDVVMGINLYSGEAGFILDNGDNMAWADYSIDDKTLVYTRQNLYGLYDIYAIGLDATKIKSTGTEQMIGMSVAMPNWFSVSTPPKIDVSFSAATSANKENVTAVNIPVKLSGTTTQTVTVDYAVTGGNAIGSGVDYTLTGNRLTFTSGQTTQNIKLTVVNDKLDKGDRTIRLTLSNPSNAWMGAIPVHTYTIQEDDHKNGARDVWGRYE